MTSSRPYELVLLGATGYTGTLTAEYIQEHVATDLKWAIAGRNSKRLHEIAEMLKKLNPNRIQPGMIDNPEYLDIRLIITCSCRGS